MFSLLNVLCLLQHKLPDKSTAAKPIMRTELFSLVAFTYSLSLCVCVYFFSFASLSCHPRFIHLIASVDCKDNCNDQRSEFFFLLHLVYLLARFYLHCSPLFLLLGETSTRKCVTGQYLQVTTASCVAFSLSFFSRVLHPLSYLSGLCNDLMSVRAVYT